MRKLVGILGIVAITTWALAQSNGTALLESHSKALKDAQSISASYTVQILEGSSGSYKVDLVKPNMARIDKPDQLIVADGKTITVLDKKDNSFYKMPQTAEDLGKQFSDDDTRIWAGFFNADALKKVVKSEAKPKINRNGMDLDVLQLTLDSQNRQTTTLFLDGDKMARQAKMESTGAGKTYTAILNVKSLAVGSKIGDDKFAFTAPDGAREIPLSELNALKWYTNLNEAKAAANKSGKKIFVDFMASWCGPCKMLAAAVFGTEDFKKLSKYFVFMQVDVDEQQDVAQTYQIEAMPTQMVLDKDGNVLGKTVGYGGPAAFFQFINQYAN